MEAITSQRNFSLRDSADDQNSERNSSIIRKFCCIGLLENGTEETWKERSQQQKIILINLEGDLQAGAAAGNALLWLLL
uniref:Uncharacterized protein n=1 Tax=Oryza glumipatula TaxID=40148 RepID=A0A0E0ADB2_9ORYZ